MLRLTTFGGLALERNDGGTAPRLRPQRLAILAVLASAGDRGISRDQIASLFWPDSDDPRHSLRQALYALRHDLGTEVIKGDTVIALDKTALDCDLIEFRSALAAGDRPLAASLAAGPFLRGFSLPSCPEFERWADEERAAISTDATKLLLALAKEANAAGDLDGAVEWSRRLTVLDPLSGRFALGYLKALASAGDRAGALAFARTHERLVRRELEADPDPEIRRLESELRAVPSPPVVNAPPRKTPSLTTTSSSADATSATAAPAQPELPLPVVTRRRITRPVRIIAALVAILAIATAISTVNRRVASANSSSQASTFAVGMIREEGVPDTLRIGGVLTDMLATNLARVAGLSVLANSRLFELMLPGQDTLVTGYSEAARRAGATEILQGRLLPGPQWTLAMEVQRVDLRSGLVKGAYRVTAADRYALVDSMTSAIASDLRLGAPPGSIADATTDNPIAYRLYEEGLRAYNQYDGSAATRLMRAALKEDSTFAMAAYYAALSIGDIASIYDRALALRLAARAPERERLTITADLKADDQDPDAVAAAESLAAKYPMDPRGYAFLWKAHHTRGDWTSAVIAVERAIALDSASEPLGRQGCRLCDDLSRLAETYFYWDSLSAAERTAHRLLRFRPKHHHPWDILMRSAAARGDTAAMHTYLRNFRESNPTQTALEHVARRYLLAEEYERAEPLLQTYLDSPRPEDLSSGYWFKQIALRNQGRLNEALNLSKRFAGPSDLCFAVASLEIGDARAARPKLHTRANYDMSAMAPSMQARQRTWNTTLIGMGEVVAGDTALVRRLADTVEYWGRRSLYGRDRRAHHYLRGMLAIARGQDNDAVAHLKEAIHSPTHGFTRVNYELGKVLMRLNRPREAVPIVRSALHGDIDGSNLYVTRTELHELLAQAFARIGSRDSAAYHYRAVIRAWTRADPRYHARRETARAWLSSNTVR